MGSSAVPSVRGRAHAAISEVVRGWPWRARLEPLIRSALKPFSILDLLEPAEAAEFEGQYAERLREAYPKRPDGTTIFPFRRLFIVASRPGG